MLLDEPIYTVPEASREARLSTWTIWDLLKQGKLMRTKVAGKTFIRQSALRKLIVDTVNARPVVRQTGQRRKKTTAR